MNLIYTNFPKLAKNISSIFNKDYYSIQANKKIHKDFKVKNESDYYKKLIGYDPNYFEDAFSAHYNSVFNYPWETAFEINDLYASKNFIEIRYPFFDKEFVEHCVSVPAHLKLNKGRTRFYFKLAMKNILPSSIAKRNNKSDLSPVALNSLRDYVKQNSDLIKNKLLGRSSRLHGLLDIDYMNKEIFNKFYKNDSYATEIYNLIALELWMEKNNFTWN